MKSNAPSGDSFWTTYSLSTPLETSRDMVGPYDIVVYANKAGLPGQVMSRLKAAFHASNSRDVRPVLAAEIDASEKKRVPLACIILGKG